jgi:ABC transporter transmembrane region
LNLYNANQGYLRYFLRYKYRIGLTYFATVLGSIFLFLYPYATGIAIDGALERNPIALLPLAIFWGTHLIVDGFRQVYDTRTFTKVFADAATEMVVEQKKTGQSTSEVAAHVNMMEEVTWFLGSTLPELVISLISPLGSLAVLFVLSPQIALATTALAVFAIAFNTWLFPSLKDRQTTINSLHEKSVSVINDGGQNEVSAHYESIGKAFVRISDLNAISWMTVQAIGIVVVAFGIWTAGGISKTTTGEAYALVAYIWRVLDGAFSVPSFAHQFARISDIWKRIANQ